MTFMRRYARLLPSWKSIEPHDAPFNVYKHVGSNKYTKYRPYPTPSQFSASPDLISRTMTFLRRELRVWEGLDVEVSTMSWVLLLFD